MHIKGQSELISLKMKEHLYLFVLALGTLCLRPDGDTGQACILFKCFLLNVLPGRNIKVELSNKCQDD